ncbi:MAG: family 43 glycosylhydrolase [Prevotella sp.]|jgi:arabinan endo-1,5-alpha-L-arabinosidase|nr:family 43 glycosylhydrolase [Prevotella sp.]
MLKVKKLPFSGYLLGTVILTGFIACQDDKADEPDVRAEIVSFSLVDTANVEHILNIDEENLFISNADSLESSVDLTRLTAKFQTAGKQVALLVKGREQISGATANDFSGLVIYDVFSAGTKQQSYTVKVTKKQASLPAKENRPCNDFSAFYFTEWYMSRYTVTVNTGTGLIANRVIIPYIVDVTQLKPYFSTFEADAQVTVNGVVQESGVTVNDFSVPVHYVIRGSDGSEKEYVVNLQRDLSAFFLNPVLEEDVPDPSFIRVGNEFYLYGTGGITSIYKSANLVIWEYVGQAMNSSDKPTFVPSGSMWAPDINYFDGKYVLYYALAQWGQNNPGIGVAVSDRPEGPFKSVENDGKMFLSDEIGVNNSIDPCFVEDNGKKYLFWGSFSSIYATELTEDGLRVKDKNVKTKVAGNAYEGVYIHKRGMFYYLFASIGSCCAGESSTYTMVVGRSANLLGPYVNKAGGEMGYDHHEVLVSRNNRFVGPGHNSEIITDDVGNDWIIYHAYLRGRTDEGRVVLLDRVEWDGEGWPFISNGYPAERSDILPVFNRN